MKILDIEIGPKIGSGAYGLVYKAMYNERDCAVKIVSKNSNNKSYASSKKGSKPSNALEARLDQLFKSEIKSKEVCELNLAAVKQMGYKYHYVKELSMHLKVHDHPNVVTIHKVLSYKDLLFVVMDYYGNGDLFGAIVEKKMFLNDATLLKKIFLQLVDVVSFCHKNKVFHCDIKPENILVSDDCSHIAITDFGLAVMSEFVADNVCCGSQYYMAPERLLSAENQRQNYYPTAAGDVWSLGIILINLVCVRNPWMKASLTDRTFETFVSRPEILYKMLPISKKLSFVLTHFLLVKNPHQRSSRNLAIVAKLVGNCTSLTKSGPLSSCDALRLIASSDSSNSNSSSSSDISSRSSSSDNNASSSSLSSLGSVYPASSISEFSADFGGEICASLFRSTKV